MKLVFMGTAGFAVPALKAVKAAGHEIALVVCQPDRPKGRGHQLQASAVKLAALEMGLEVFQPEKIKDSAAVGRISALKFDALCVVAYGQILPKAVLDAPRLMPLNVHASLLPKYRGAAPVEWAVAMGEMETGVCVQKMAEKLDSGDLIFSDVLAINAADEAALILPRLSEMGAVLLLRALDALAGGSATLIPQDETRVSFAPLLKKSHGIADFAMNSAEIFNRFRGFKARPGFYTGFAGDTLKIHGLSPAQGSGEAGQLLEIAPQGLRVGCQNGSVWITEIQSPGGIAMQASDWARGRKVSAGLRLESPVF